MRSPSRIAIVTHGKPERIGDAVARLEEAARAAGVAVVEGDGADLVVVLGGDGTMLRALKGSLDDGVPVLGVNFGRVGFLTALPGDQLEAGLARVFAGEYAVVELPTLELEARGERHTAVNDVVATSSTLGRMIELGWSVGGEDLGLLACDGVIASTPSGSTAYNLSNGGPVLVWGLEAMAVTFVAPHSLHARPLVVPVGLDLAIENRTADVAVAVIVDGHQFAELPPEGAVDIRFSGRRSVLASLPEWTFFRRYGLTFAA